MSDLKTISETGGFYVEFNGTFLGAGQAVFELQSQTRELRRDDLHQLRGRVLRGMTLGIKVKLSAGDRFWELLCVDAMQSEMLCCSGGSLHLYPLNTLLSGYAFERVFLENVVHQSGDAESSGALDLVFTAENGSDGTWKFSRLDVGALPPAVSAAERVSIANVTRKLMDFLQGELNAVPGQDLCLNFPAPGHDGSYLLKLQKCSCFHWQGARRIDYTLTAAFPLSGKNDVDAAMAELAEKLNGLSLAEQGKTALRCQVESLDLSRTASSNGRTITDNILEFSVFAG